ncbi:hypothetical protein BDZ91DRAFT_133350 [Kalaharituber pfeilii]|nr:hypothetical protein BDZ91DRAFT_133350 [Kalaharituber pfeilii]
MELLSEAQSPLNFYAMSGHRPHFRNVRFCDEANPNVVLGSLVHNGFVTEEKTFSMCLTSVRVSARDNAKGLKRFELHKSTPMYT